MIDLDLLLSKIRRIVSDGDWDGILATSLLIKLARRYNIEPIISYPHPKELRSMKLNDVVSIEITPTKTQITNSIIFDHHEKIEGYGNIWIFDDKAPSVAALVSEVLGIPTDEEILDAVNAIDQGNWRQDILSQLLFKAYQIDPVSFPRLEITYKLAKDDFKSVIELCKARAKAFKNIERRANELKKGIKVLFSSPSVVYFTYNVGRDEGARRLALLDLEEEFDIVIALGVENENFVTGTIATKRRGINLMPIFRDLRNMGYNAGGRRNVGGFQTIKKDVKLERVLNDLIKILEKDLST
mgnify:CR=1 FL=1